MWFVGPSPQDRAVPEVRRGRDRAPGRAPLPVRCHVRRLGRPCGCVSSAATWPKFPAASTCLVTTPGIAPVPPSVARVPPRLISPNKTIAGEPQSVRWRLTASPAGPKHMYRVGSISTISSRPLAADASFSRFTVFYAAAKARTQRRSPRRPPRSTDRRGIRWGGVLNRTKIVLRHLPFTEQPSDSGHWGGEGRPEFQEQMNRPRSVSGCNRVGLLSRGDAPCFPCEHAAFVSSSGRSCSCSERGSS